MKSDLNKKGYDKEEEYFHKLNQELIKKQEENKTSKQSETQEPKADQ